VKQEQGRPAAQSPGRIFKPEQVLNAMGQDPRFATEKNECDRADEWWQNER
jgi:hypothetical protein